MDLSDFVAVHAAVSSDAAVNSSCNPFIRKSSSGAPFSNMATGSITLVEWHPQLTSAETEDGALATQDCETASGSLTFIEVQPFTMAYDADEAAEAASEEMQLQQHWREDQQQRQQQRRLGLGDGLPAAGTSCEHSTSTADDIVKAATSNLALQQRHEQLSDQQVVSKMEGQQLLQDKHSKRRSWIMRQWRRLKQQWAAASPGSSHDSSRGSSCSGSGGSTPQKKSVAYRERSNTRCLASSTTAAAPRSLSDDASASCPMDSVPHSPFKSVNSISSSWNIICKDVQPTALSHDGQQLGSSPLYASSAAVSTQPPGHPAGLCSPFTAAAAAPVATSAAVQEVAGGSNAAFRECRVDNEIAGESQIQLPHQAGSVAGSAAACRAAGAPGSGPMAPAELTALLQQHPRQLQNSWSSTSHVEGVQDLAAKGQPMATAAPAALKSPGTWSATPLHQQQQQQQNPTEGFEPTPVLFAEGFEQLSRSSAMVSLEAPQQQQKLQQAAGETRQQKEEQQLLDMLCDEGIRPAPQQAAALADLSGVSQQLDLQVEASSHADVASQAPPAAVLVQSGPVLVQSGPGPAGCQWQLEQQSLPQPQSVPGPTEGVNPAAWPAVHVQQHLSGAVGTAASSADGHSWTAAALLQEVQACHLPEGCCPNTAGTQLPLPVSCGPVSCDG
jgi:hypothetical protein